MELLKQFFSFHGGVKVDSRKSHTLENIRYLPVPERLTIPLTQHIGQSALPVVNIGDKVLKGQLIADLDEQLSARIHAPSSGVIKDIGLYPVPHPSGLNAECIVIETDGKDEWQDHQGVKKPERLSPEQIITYIENAGIVGLGGAAFPLAVKLDRIPEQKIELLIINGAECEPYISCDEQLMFERAEEVVLGARLAQRALKAKTCIIAIEDDIPETFQKIIETVKNYVDQHVQVAQVPELYPSGSEKQLIQLITGKEVPQKGFPADIGVSCINVGTAAAAYRSIYQGEPLISRIVSITGKAVKNPGNYEVLLGTPMQDLLTHAGVDQQSMERLLMGGPMMGFTLNDTSLPIIKASNCLLAAADNELQKNQPAMPCIRCGRCAQSCPMQLLPQQMYWYAQAKDLEKCEAYHIFDCIECGCCSYVCPSNIPLVHYYRFAKSEIRAQSEAKKKADLARERYELREARLEKIKAEKAEKRKHMQARKKSMEIQKPEKSAATDTAKTDEEDPIKAAMRRVQEKKARQQKTTEKD